MKRVFAAVLIMSALILMPVTLAAPYKSVSTCLEDPLFSVCLNNAGVTIGQLQGNSTEQIQDAVAAAFNFTISYDDIGNGMGVNQTWINATIDARTAATRNPSKWINGSNFIQPNSSYSENVNITGNLTVGGSGTFITVRMQISGEPAVPPEGSLYFYVANDSGYAKYNYKDYLGVVRSFNDVEIVVRNVRGTTIAKHRLVYQTGNYEGKPTIDLADASNVSRMPAFCVTIETITNGSLGRCIKSGTLHNVNTIDYELGKIYVSDFTPGIPTNTKPLTPNVTQDIGNILVKNESIGEIDITIRGLTGDEFGTAQNLFKIGDGQAGDKNLTFNSDSTGNIIWNNGYFNFSNQIRTPLVNSSILLGDAQQVTQFLENHTDVQNVSTLPAKDFLVIINTSGIMTNFPADPGLTSRLRYVPEGGGLQWYPDATAVPGLPAVCIVGCSTGLNNLGIDDGQRIEFGGTGTSINKSSNGDFNFNTNTSIIMNANVRINPLYAYQVADDQAAFQSITDTDIEQLFTADGVKSRVEWTSTTGRVLGHINVFNGNGTKWWSDSTYFQDCISVGNMTCVGEQSGTMLAPIVAYEVLSPRSPHILAPNPTTGTTQLCLMKPKGGWVKLEVLENDSIEISQDDGECSGPYDNFVQENQTWNQYITDKAACELSNEYFYTSYDEYKNGSRECFFDVSEADKNCKSSSLFAFFNTTLGKCGTDKKALCESIQWQFWDDGKQVCSTNKFLHCNFHPDQGNYTWNYTGRACEFDWAKECNNRGGGWFWHGEKGICEWDDGKNLNSKRKECESRGKKWIWNGEECEYAGNF